MSKVKTLRIFALMTLLFAVGAVSSFAQNHEDRLSEGKGLLRFDGLYRTKEIVHPQNNRIVYRMYLRFCENKRVASASSDLPAERVGKILKCDKNAQTDYSVGEYKLENNKISFTTVSTAGKVDFDGEVLTDLVKLDIYSHINGNSVKGREYTFIAVAFDD